MQAKKSTKAGSRAICLMKSCCLIMGGARRPPPFSALSLNTDHLSALAFEIPGAKPADPCCKVAPFSTAKAERLQNLIPQMMADYPNKADVPVVVYQEQPKPGEPAPPYVRDVNSTVELLPSAPQPQDHVLWSLFNAMFLNFCCMGFVALVFSIKSRDRKMLRDSNGASHYAATAKTLNIISSALGIISTIAFLVIFVLKRY